MLVRAWTLFACTFDCEHACVNIIPVYTGDAMMPVCSRLQDSGNGKIETSDADMKLISMRYTVTLIIFHHLRAWNRLQ